MYTEGKKTYKAGEAVVPNRRVKLSAYDTVMYADAGEDWIGVTENVAALDAHVTVRDKKSPGSQEIEALGVIAAGVDFYGAADGKISATQVGEVLGKSLDNSTADGCIIECYLNDGVGDAVGDGSLPVVFSDVVTDANTADVVIATAKFKFKIIDWWIIARDATAANVKIKNNATDASAVIAKGIVDDARVQGGTIIAEQDEIVVGDPIKVNASAVAAFDIFVMAIRVV